MTIDRIETGCDMSKLGETVNDVIVTKLNRPGSVEHDAAMRKLTDLIANDPNALIELGRTQS